MDQNGLRSANRTGTILEGAWHAAVATKKTGTGQDTHVFQEHLLVVPRVAPSRVKTGENLERSWKILNKYLKVAWWGAKVTGEEERQGTAP